MTDKMEGMVFEALGGDTLLACARIAAHAPDPWREADLEAAMRDLNQWSFVARGEDGVLGFACYLVVSENADLQMLAVAPEHRRRGVGDRLLTHSLIELQKQGVRRVLLEVRQSNFPAIRLYEKLGFKKMAHRPGMYQTPAEDGILMARGLAQYHGTEQA